MTSEKPSKIITADPLSVREYLAEMVKYRGLIWLFAYQEIKTLYAQTYFGILWAVLRPLIILSIFTVIFNYLLKIKTNSPYYLFAFSGMIAWNLFQQIVQTASSAIVQKQQLIRKMYFPKLVLPLSKVLVACVEAFVSLVVIFAMMLYEWHPLSVKLLTLPFFIFLNICTGLAVSLWMSNLNIRYRDLNQIVMPIIGIGIWFTPVFFPTTIIPAQYQWLLYLNPIAGIIEGFRFALLGEAFPDKWYFVSIAITLGLFLMGALYLTKVEDDIVDYA
ncbi:MAG: ABC transporter permease [Bacteroidota bacterium]